MQQFFLVRVVPGAEPELLPGYGPYAYGAAAAAQAKWLSAEYGLKIQPRPIGELPDWRPREAHRRETRWYFGPTSFEKPNRYDPIPDGFGLDLDPDHCALIRNNGQDEPTISFFESDTKARLDQRTNLKTGRYLKRYVPDIPDDRLKRLVALVDPPVEVLFATTRDEIRRVYVEGPSSCMSMAERPEWQGLPCHPVEAYAAGDLAIAYIQRSGCVTARAVCWPAKRQYGRVYGDSFRLIRALDGLGYRKVDVLVGARLLRIPATRQIDAHRHLLQDRPGLVREGFLVPYLDNADLLIDRGDHLVTAPRGPLRDKTLRPYAHGNIPSVSIPAGWCDRLEHWVDGPTFRIRGLEQTWSQRALYDSGIHVFRCEATRDFWLVDTNYFVDLYDGRRWCREHFEAHGFVCALSRWNCPNEDRTERDGKPVSLSYLREVEERDRKLAQIRENERASREGRSQYDLSFGYRIPAVGEVFEVRSAEVDVNWGVPLEWRVQYIETSRIRRRAADFAIPAPVITAAELREAMDRPVTLGEAVETVVNAAVTNANRPPANPMPSDAEMLEAMREALSRPYRPAQGFANVFVDLPATIERITLEARPNPGWGALWDDPIPEPEADPRRRPWHALVDNDQIRSTRQGRRQQRRRG